MAHVAAMEALGISYGGMTEGTAPLAAYVLSLQPDALAEVVGGGESVASAAGAWMRRNGIGRREALSAAAECLSAAFSAYVPKSDGGRNEVRLKPRGYGWPVEVAETLMHRYGMSFREAMAEPLCRVFALMAAADAAEGCGGGPDYYERMQIAEIRRAKVEALRRMLDEADRQDAESGGTAAKGA